MDHLDPVAVHFAMPALVKELAALGAKRVILYGSRARGDNMPRADIDLAVDAPDGIDTMTWSKMTDAVENAQTLLEIDLVHLQKAGDKFKANILKDGKILYDAG